MPALCACNGLEGDLDNTFSFVKKLFHGEYWYIALRNGIDLIELETEMEQDS